MQARWQVLNEEIDCTEEEQFLFASLQLQVGLQANVPQPKVSITCKWKLLPVPTKKGQLHPLSYHANSGISQNIGPHSGSLSQKITIPEKSSSIVSLFPSPSLC